MCISSVPVLVEYMIRIEIRRHISVCTCKVRSSLNATYAKIFIGKGREGAAHSDSEIWILGKYSALELVVFKLKSVKGAV